MCEPKRRHLQKDEKWVINAFMVYQRFYQIHQNNSKEKTYTDFCDSAYYNAFVKFGSFVNNVRPLYPEKYIDYVVTSGVKLDHWCRDELYDLYIKELIKIEPADGAIQRSITTMIDWANEHQAEWNHYFSYVNLNRATYDIKEGKVSPWIVLNCKAGKEMLQKMNDEQLEIIGQVIDPSFWQKRFKKLPADVELVKEVVKESKMQ